MHSDDDSGAVCVVGSLNYDLVCILDRLPAKGETLTASAHVAAFGGKGANQAVAAARLGAPVKMIGAVGSDRTGADMVRNLDDNGVDASAILVADVPSGIAMINVDAAGDNTIVVYPGANAVLGTAWIRDNADAIRSSACLVLQLEIPLEAVTEAAKIAVDAGVPVLLNPAPARQLPDDLLRLCAAITPNETELGILSGKSGIEAGAAELLARGAGAVIVTLGKDGCLYMDGNGSFAVPSYPVDAVDLTAAGDSFNGALATRLRFGPTGPVDLAFCNAAGALAATRLGAQPSIPTLAEVRKFIEQRRTQ